jgi:hypothetical protein
MISSYIYKQGEVDMPRHQIVREIIEIASLVADPQMNTSFRYYIGNNIAIVDRLSIYPEAVIIEPESSGCSSIPSHYYSL